ALAAALQDEGLRVVSGGTDNHLLLIDLGRDEDSLSGKEAEHILDEVNITVNKNTVPRETRSPFVTSGLRMGSAAGTTRGAEIKDMQAIAQIIGRTFRGKEAERTRLADEIREFISPFYLT